MIRIVLNTCIDDCKEFRYGKGTARIVGSKLVVEDGNQCVLITEFVNVKELVRMDYVK